MTKFKVGDKVRILEEHNTVDDAKIGGIAEIIGGFDGVDYKVLYETNSFRKSVGFIPPKKIELIESKPTKNQRITALEETVKHMRAELDKSFEVEQDLLNRISALEFVLAENSKLTTNIKSVPQLNVSKTVKTANELRAEIIEKAKMFLDENGGDDYHFDIDEKNGTVFAYKVIISGVGRYSVKYGLSKCHPNDVFNTDIGKVISFGRAEKLDVTEFEQAVQPTKAVNGQLLTFNSGILSTVYEVINVNSNDSLKIIQDDNCKNVGRTAFGDFSEDLSPLKIINDTNARY